jgi:hypothetical protein
MSACPDNYRDVEGYFELPNRFRQAQPDIGGILRWLLKYFFSQATVSHGFLSDYKTN